MIIVMQKHAPEPSIEHVVAELIQRGFDVHRSTGWWGKRHVSSRRPAARRLPWAGTRWWPQQRSQWQSWRVS